MELVVYLRGRIMECLGGSAIMAHANISLSVLSEIWFYRQRVWAYNQAMQVLLQTVPDWATASLSELPD